MKRSSKIGPWQRGNCPSQSESSHFCQRQTLSTNAVFVFWYCCRLKNKYCHIMCITFPQWFWSCLLLFKFFRTGSGPSFPLRQSNAFWELFDCPEPPYVKTSCPKRQLTNWVTLFSKNAFSDKQWKEYRVDWFSETGGLFCEASTLSAGYQSQPLTSWNTRGSDGENPTALLSDGETLLALEARLDRLYLLFVYCEEVRGSTNTLAALRLNFDSYCKNLHGKE